jgi:acetolactate synthase-1/3 small subunit
MIIEISGQEKKVESFIELMRPFGILELVRTGRIAMVRGETTLGFDENNNGHKYQECSLGNVAR